MGDGTKGQKSWKSCENQLWNHDFDDHLEDLEVEIMENWREKDEIGDRYEMFESDRKRQ